MISNKQYDNLINMIYGNYCEVTTLEQFGSLKLRYKIDVGHYETEDLKGEIQEFDRVMENKIPRKEFINEDGTKFITYSHKYILYGSFLEDCFHAFEKEIELNLLHFPLQSTKIEYLTKINKRFNDIKLNCDENITKLTKTDITTFSSIELERYYFELCTDEIISDEIKSFLFSFQFEFLDEYQIRTSSINKYPAKFYALYHWLLITIGKAHQFPKDEYGNFIKIQIENFAKISYPSISAQSFYRSFTSLDITQKTAIAKDFKKGYKDKIIDISKNDAEIIIALKIYPN